MLASLHININKARHDPYKYSIRKQRLSISHSVAMSNMSNHHHNCNIWITPYIDKELPMALWPSMNTCREGSPLSPEFKMIEYEFVFKFPDVMIILHSCFHVLPMMYRKVGVFLRAQVTHKNNSFIWRVCLNCYSVSFHTTNNIVRLLCVDWLTTTNEKQCPPRIAYVIGNQVMNPKETMPVQLNYLSTSPTLVFCLR